MKVSIAIAGQPTNFLPVPPAEPERALRAIAELERDWSHRRLFGFLDPLLSASWEAGPAVLRTRCHRDLTRRGVYPASIEWRWGRLWAHDTWYEVGWHPDVNFDALAASARPAIWRALNPGKDIRP